MTEIDKFDKIWNDHFQATVRMGKKFRQTKRDRETQERYENILFSIWKHHPDWDKDNGFQIKCRDRTIYRVLDLAEEAGLLIKVKNYSVGNHTRMFHKNHKLFDHYFRNQENKYGVWLNQGNVDQDIIYNHLLNQCNNNINIPYVAIKSGLTSTKVKKLNYDLNKLYELSEKMLLHYYRLLEKMNNKTIHPDLNFISWLKFDNDGLPTGRPFSYFCSTLNRKKKHKIIDPSMEYRDDFLKRVGLPDYYEVYDIKSEIPRINHLFHTGEWKDDDCDFYSEMIKDTEMAKYLEWEVRRGDTPNYDYEDSMKQLFMRVYFGKGSDLQSYNGYLNDKLKRVGNNYMSFWYDMDKKEEIDFEMWKVICNSVRNICGPSLGNLVFWFSFFIETEVKIELLKQGKIVYNVYDGFYYNQDIKAEIVELLKVKAQYVYNNYMKLIKIS